MTIDQDQIIKAILESGVGPVAAESGVALLEHWISATFGKDSEKRIVAVECGFVCWLDENTVTIGVQDLLTSEPSECPDEGCPHYRTKHSHPNEDAIVGNEWKSTKEKTKYWNEDTWFESISDGSQLGIYALALREGTYYERATGASFTPKVAEPRIRVRAVSKSAIPVIWPTRGEGIVSFRPEQIDVVKNAVLAKAAALRAMRRSENVPWQLPGIWCTNQFRRTCAYHEDCLAQRIPEGWGKFDVNDPAFTLALPHIGDRVGDPDLVILGASAYAAYSECPENGRRSALGGNREESLPLEVGSALHAGLSEYYSQIKVYQNTKSLDNKSDVL